MELSKHCQARIQQRGINIETVHLIKNYGQKINTHGDYKMFINKKSLKKLCQSKEMGMNFKKLEKQIKTTAIVVSSCGKKCITAMKINKRIRWN